MEELLEDYLDFLRVRDFRIWDKDSKEAQFARKLGRTAPLSYEVFREIIETRSPEVIANIAICLINQANYLIDKQLEGLAEAFTENGGLRERMTRARLQAREQNSSSR